MKGPERHAFYQKTPSPFPITRLYTEQTMPDCAVVSHLRDHMHLKQHTLSSAESHGKLPTVTNLGYEWITNSMASVC